MNEGLRQRPPRNGQNVLPTLGWGVLASIIGGVFYDQLKRPEVLAPTLLFSALAGALIFFGIMAASLGRNIQSLKRVSSDLSLEEPEAPRLNARFRNLKNATRWFIASNIAFAITLVGAIVAAPYLLS